MSTKTKSFGNSYREGHDSSAFYQRRMQAVQLTEDCTVNTPPPLDCIFMKSSESLDELPDNCVSLMVTSPPYNVGKDYDADLSLEDYLGLLSRVMGETWRVLQPGGRACINLANVGRKPYVPLASFVNMLMLDIGFLMRGEIIWLKGKGANASCAWGSFQSASNPALRDVHEYILVYSKGRFDRVVEGEDTIEKADFMRDTVSAWEIHPVQARTVGHPAPFPRALPRRLIELYTFKGDLVLDPFCGSGTTCLAAEETGRAYVGYEIQEEYVRLARSQLGQMRLW